jgi:cytochrome P450
VPKNSLIIISPWYVQRHNRIWERPDEFDPLRWQEMPAADCKRQAFLPFSSGPRICPGAGFAMVERRSEISVKLQRFAGSAALGASHFKGKVRNLSAF